MAVTRYPVSPIPTVGRKVLTAVVGLATAALIITSESLAPVPLAVLACLMVAAGFGFGAYAAVKKVTVDQPHATAWDFAGLLLFAGFALATALGSSWMGV